MIVHGFAPWILKKLKEKLTRHKFTLMVDESTGKGGERFFAICVRFSENFCPKTYLLKLTIVQGPANANNLYLLIDKHLTQDCKILCNLICFTTDGASVMRGGKANNDKKLQKSVN